MMRKLAVATLLAVALLAVSVRPVLSGPVELILQRLSGQLDYENAAGNESRPIAGQLAVQARGYALTRANSMAALDLPDSSVVSIGASSRVRLGHFDRERWGSSATMTIVDGAVHFAVKHPAGARANYTFITPVSQIAVRGTEGIIVTRGDETIIACVHGTKNDIYVTYGANQKMYVPDGMTVRIRGRMGRYAQMSMHPGIAGSEFAQFSPVMARHHAMRMRGLEK